MKKVGLNADEAFITLGQLLKLEGIIQTGGQAKHYLGVTEVLVNGEPEERRGRKLREGDKIKIAGTGEFLIGRR